MHCPSCGFENPEGLKFCNECGTPLRMPCAQCGFTKQPQAKFCGECGAALLPQAGVSSAPPVAPRPHAPLSYTPTHLAEKILTSKAALEGERKQVTVLFADLKGSVELLADRDPEDARAILDPVLERGLALCQTWSIRDWCLVLAAALGDAYALCGRLAEALPLLEQTVEQDAMRRRHLSSLWIAWLSEGYMLAGRLANAMPLARQALDLARDGRERGCEAWALRLLGEIHSHQDSLDADQTAAHYRQAFALAEALGMRPLQAHCHRGLGTLYTKIDQREQARAELSAAIALYRPMDMSFWLPQAEAALAQVEGR
jgi:tetratricopeptide (TPR) repeat protein